MILGRRALGSYATSLVHDTAYVIQSTMPVEGYATEVILAIDGGGVGIGSQLLKGVIFDSTGAVVAVGSERSLAVTSPLQWLGLNFLPNPPLLKAGASYRYGFVAGTTDNVARISTAGMTGGFTAANSEATPTTLSGAAAAGAFSIALSYTQPYVASTEVTDYYLARLPFAQAQIELARTGVITGTLSLTQAGWHGTLTDPERGSFAVVRTDGPLADLVGERIKVSYEDRCVYAYVHTDADIIEDLSLTRRAFIALSFAATTELDVTVEILGAAS